MNPGRLTRSCIVSGAWQVHAADGTVLYGPDGLGLPIEDLDRIVAGFETVFGG